MVILLAEETAGVGWASILWGTVIIGPLVLAVVGLLSILLDEDKSAKWRGRVYQCLYRISGRRDQEKKYISNDIKGRLNLARRKMHVGRSVLPRAVEVEWVEGAVPEALDIADGEFVIRLDPSESQPKNISSLARLLVERTTLRGLRSSLGEAIKRAIDMNLVRDLLQELGSKEVLEWYLANEYGPAVTRTAASERANRQIRVLDERGLFAHVLLVELDELSDKAYGMAPTEALGRSVASLVDFLYSIVTKKAGDLPPLDLRTAHLHIGVILVGKVGKVIHKGVGPYVTAMHGYINDGVNTVYLLAYDKEWLGEKDEEALQAYRQRMEDLKQAMLTQTMAEEDFALNFGVIDHEGQKRRATCIRYKFPYGEDLLKSSNVSGG